jgi:hypothetical protein
MIPQSSSVANSPGRKRRAAGFKPIPVSKFPDEQVFRLCRVTRTLPGRFHGDAAVPAGVLVMVRRSPHRDAPRSYWVETEHGLVLAVITEAMFERDLEVIRA